MSGHVHVQILRCRCLVVDGCIFAWIASMELPLLNICLLCQTCRTRHELGHFQEPMVVVWICLWRQRRRENVAYWMMMIRRMCVCVFLWEDSEFLKKRRQDMVSFVSM